MSLLFATHVSAESLQYDGSIKKSTIDTKEFNHNIAINKKTGLVYVSEDKQIIVIDAKNFKEIKKITYEDSQTTRNSGVSFYEIVVNQEKNVVYVVTTLFQEDRINWITVIDGKTNTVLKRIDLPDVKPGIFYSISHLRIDEKSDTIYVDAFFNAEEPTIIPIIINGKDYGVKSTNEKTVSYGYFKKGIRYDVDDLSYDHDIGFSDISILKETSDQVLFLDLGSKPTDLLFLDKNKVIFINNYSINKVEFTDLDQYIKKMAPNQSEIKIQQASVNSQKKILGKNTKNFLLKQSDFGWTDEFWDKWEIHVVTCNATKLKYSCDGPSYSISKPYEGVKKAMEQGMFYELGDNKLTIIDYVLLQYENNKYAKKVFDKFLDDAYENKDLVIKENINASQIKNCVLISSTKNTISLGFVCLKDNNFVQFVFRSDRQNEFVSPDISKTIMNKIMGQSKSSADTQIDSDKKSQTSTTSKKDMPKTKSVDSKLSVSNKVKSSIYKGWAVDLLPYAEDLDANWRLDDVSSGAFGDMESHLGYQNKDTSLLVYIFRFNSVSQVKEGYKNGISNLGMDMSMSKSVNVAGMTCANFEDRKFQNQGKDLFACYKDNVVLVILHSNKNKNSLDVAIDFAKIISKRMEKSFPSQLRKEWSYLVNLD